MTEGETGPAQSIGSLLAAQTDRRGDQVALIGDDGHGTYRALSYSELRALARALGQAIRIAVARAGVEASGARVAWSFDNRNALSAIVTYHAVAEIGAVNVPVNPASSQDEVAGILARANVSLLVGIRAVTELSTNSNATSWTVDSFDDLREIVAAHRPDPAEVEVGPEAPAIVLFTSGTTGRSKGVVHTHRTALAAGSGWREAFDLGASDVYQSMFPIYAGGGLHFSWLACLGAGATYLVDQARPTAASLQRVEQHRSTVYAGVPSIYEYWLAESLTYADLSSLRLLDFGGSVMRRSTIEALRAALPNVDLLQTYGLTEAGPGGLYLPPHLLDAHLGSVGCVGSGGLRFRVRPNALAPEHPAAAEVRPTDGVVGELQLAGPSLMLGYLDDPEGTASVFDGEWMHTGDLVRIDPEGFVYFLDRFKDLIVRGGFNIASVEVEEAVLAHPTVGLAAAFGVPHPTLGEVVGVALVPEGEQSIDLGALGRFLESRLARVKRPAYVVVLDALPVSTAGKVAKSALRKHPELVVWPVTE